MTKATAYFFSSESDKEILIFFLNLLLIFFLVIPSNVMNGLPFFSFSTTISLKFIPFETPVPRAFEKASFAANLFA